jgi:hypothetical protein
VYVLERALEIYGPFSPEETKVLRGFVASMRTVAGMRFFSQVPSKASFSFEEGKGAWSEMDEPDEQDLRAAITELRKVYTHNEPYSFKKAFALLKRSVHEHGGPLRDETMEALDGHLEAEKRVMREGVGMGFVVESGNERRDVKPREILDAYFHGKYLHEGNELSVLVEQLDSLDPFARYTFFQLMLALRNVFWAAANVVDRVLRHPDLVDASA